MGYVIAPEYLTKEFRNVHQFSVFSVNTPIQYALADYMEDESKYLNLAGFFQSKRDLLKAFLDSAGFTTLRCQGSYFMLADYSGLSDLDDMEFAEIMSKEYGVATIPLSPFYTDPPKDKVLRFCFAKTEETLKEAGKRLQRLTVG